MNASVHLDHTRPLTERVDALLGALSFEEKVAFLHQHQPPVERLGTAAFTTGTEAAHGLAWLGPATVFPQVVGLASTWDPELMERVGAAVGDEVRAFHHATGRCGLNVWAPVVNPLRDPRWGRNEEGHAEDPWLTGVLATAYSRGLRGDHPVYLKTAPTLKHFLAYNNETDRCVTSSNLGRRVLHEYELPAYRKALTEGAAVAVMASYNLINGRPAHVSPLIGEVLREWQPDVVVVSDAQAPSNLVDPQHYFDDHAHSHAAALRAGIDSFTDNSADSEPTIARVTEALHKGLIEQSDVDVAVRRLLTLRFRLGEFDPPELNPYTAIPAEVIDSPGHRALAREAATDGFVLLKRECGLLPLAPERSRTVAVLGPLGDRQLTDWYSGTLPYAVTAKDGLAARLGADQVTAADGADTIALSSNGLAVVSDGLGALRLAPSPPTAFAAYDWGGDQWTLLSVASGRFVTVAEDGTLSDTSPGPHEWVVRETFVPGYLADGGLRLRHPGSGKWLRAGDDGILRADASETAAGVFTVEVLTDGAAEAARLAAEADVAVVVLGNHPLVNGRETEDRPDLALPPAQQRLLEAVHAANPRTVLVLQSSYPYAITWAQDRLPAILWSAHGGQEYGHALAEVLYGDAEPGGRLTQTWYRDAADLPDLLDYDVIAGEATYLYFRGTPLYPFGHGLGYGTVEYKELRLSTDTVDADGTVEAEVVLANPGERPAVEVVQLYGHRARSRIPTPLRQLRAFAKVRLAPGESRSVTLRVDAAELGHWDVGAGRWTVPAARHRLQVGRAATDIQLSATITVRGEAPSPRVLLGELLAADHDDYCDAGLVPETPLSGDAVAATRDGAWTAFHDVTVDPSVTACRMRAANPSPIPATVTLRRFDPHAGPVLAAFTVPPTGGPQEFAVLDAPLPAAPGAGDLYLVYGTAGIVVGRLDFRVEST
ncbi:glycoside hydrolase family 3 protein [Phytomonospora endophytica]|uniref:Beta-glucosidase n=1 Tax=Phytomonospora endophytica TaxID=714109 RepID=A0A841F5X5_9ACTN|nr:glycoside hydrolase family 3 protein [Phytomonospora endophytica]MBB6032331.1 beta-glucosidase [Phytomonospora endophytica]GIG68679.1 sugar hydrolase [Phytomonospora endophytica]